MVVLNRNAFSRRLGEGGCEHPPYVVVATLFIVTVICAASVTRAAVPPQMSPQSANLIRRLQIGVVAGRIVAKSTPSRVQPIPARGTNETLRIQAEAGETLLRFEKNDESDHTLIELGRGSGLVVTRTPGAEPNFEPVRFEQFATTHSVGYQASPVVPDDQSRGVVLVVGGDDSQTRVEAAGIWQLLIVEPDLCREHLTPLLDLLHTNWRLEQMAGGIEEQLVLLVQAGDLEVTAYWDELIHRLGDDVFAVRRRADRLLRQAGVDVLPYLHSTDVARLDAEQRMRIREITRDLSSGVGQDTPRLAAWQLVDDVSVWLTLLGRDNPATRSVARERLEAILDRTIDFDVTADPAQREQELANLQAELEQIGLLTVRRVPSGR